MDNLGPKPSPVQGRLLMALHAEPRLLIERRNAFFSFEGARGVPRPRIMAKDGAYRDADPKRITVVLCARMGWLELVPGEEARDKYGVEWSPYGHVPTYHRLSELGRQWAERFTPEDLVSKPRAKRPSTRPETARILRALRARHSDPREWIHLTEYRPLPLGYGLKQRRMDLFTLNCYQSEDFRRVGYEIKVTRSDFRSDVKNIKKIADLARLCSEFYFAAPKGLIDPDDVPDPYGLVIVMPNGRTRIEKRSHMDKEKDADGMGWPEVASMMRQLREMYEEDQ